MFNLGLTHDQVAAAKERAGTSVWNYFESLRTHNGLFPGGAKFIVCLFIALYSLGALTGIAYSLGIALYLRRRSSARHREGRKTRRGHRHSSRG